MSNQAVKAINFLISKQDYSDLRYWLALVSYDPEEKGFSNRIYLLYLIVFFAIWFLIVLVFLANGFLKFLPIFGPMPIETLLSTCLLLLFSAFTIFNLISASLRSPLIFSEEHRYLLCQQPVPPQPLVLRWILAPWLKNFLIFGFLGTLLGMVFAEANFPGNEMASYLPLYIWYGIRVFLLTLPFHFASFVSSWAVGIFACNHRQKVFAWLPCLALIPLIAAIFLSLFLPAFFELSFPVLAPITKTILQLTFSFLGIKGFGFGTALLIGLLLSALSLVLLWLTAKRFSPSKAAVETEKAALIGSLTRYAQFDAVKQVKREGKLSLSAKTSFAPNWQDSMAFLWKAFIITKRSFSLNDLWLTLYPLLFIPAFAFAGNSPTSWLGIISWVWILSQNSLSLFQRDLEQWQLTRQIPSSIQHWGLIELLTPLIPTFLTSILGTVIAQSLFNINALQFLPIFIIGLTAAQLQLGQDLLNKNQPDDLISGSIRSIGLRGLALAVACLLLPLLVHLFPIQPINLILAILTAFGLVWFGLAGLFKQIKSFSSDQKSSLFLF